MKSWLFLDMDEVVSTYRHAISIGEIGGVRQSWDDTGMRLIERAIEGHDIHLVISSAWRYCQAEWNPMYFARRFRAEGYQELYRALVRTIDMFTEIPNPDGRRGHGWSTGERLDSRAEEIDNYVFRWCQGDCVVALDDCNIELKSTTGFVHVSTPLDGISVENFVKMRDIFDKAVSNTSVV